MDVGIYLRDGKFSSDSGLANLHPTEGTHWVAYINEIFSIHMDVHRLKQYLASLQNEMFIVYILNTKYKTQISFFAICCWYII